jgi:hypothetical protein
VVIRVSVIVGETLSALVANAVQATKSKTQVIESKLAL